MTDDQLRQMSSAFLYGPDCPSAVDRDRLFDLLKSVAAQARRKALDQAYERIGIALRAFAGEAEKS